MPGILGMISVDLNETRWVFTPLEVWKAGEYRVEIDPRLEDAAGNRVDHVLILTSRETIPKPAERTIIPLPLVLTRG